MADKTTPNSTSPPIKCPIMTHSGYDVDNDEYFCEYESWAYGIFAVVGILFVMVPLVSLICCIVRMKARRKYSGGLRSRVSIDSYATSSEQPLLSDSMHHENPTYGAVEPLSPRRSPTNDSYSERRSKSQDSISLASSRASLMPNYDQASLDIRNLKATNNFQSTYNPPGPINRPEGLSSSSNTASPLTSNLLAPASRSKTNSPIYAVPEESSPKISQEYAVLEQPESMHNKSEAKGSNSRDISNIVDRGDDDDMKKVTASLLDSKIPNNEPVYDVLEPTKIENVSQDSAGNAKENIAPENMYASLENTRGTQADPHDEEPRYMSLVNQNSRDNTDKLVDNSDQSSNDQQKEKDIISDKDSDTIGEKQNQDNQINDDKQLDKDKDNSVHDKQTDEDIQVNSSVNKAQQGNQSNDNDDDGSKSLGDQPSSRSRERTKSRAVYQDILHDAIKSFPVDERNGCFMLRDSVSSPGCKALTLYNKTPNKQQEFYNFKICFDDQGQAFLAKSNQRFSTIEELLDYLRSNKDMLPCTLKNQIA